MRDRNFKNMSKGEGGVVAARFGKDGIIIVDPNRTGEGAGRVFQRIYDKAL